MMVKYSIAVCNKNMADTLERSLKSILNQIDDRFEMIVIDDGSVDNSVNILKNLSKEYKNLRYLHIEPDKNQKPRFFLSDEIFQQNPLFLFHIYHQYLRIQVCIYLLNFQRIYF
jgi:glycosyltransferase involved in cell wall biosynthesis